MSRISKLLYTVYFLKLVVIIGRFICSNSFNVSRHTNCYQSTEATFRLWTTKSINAVSEENSICHKFFILSDTEYTMAVSEKTIPKMLFLIICEQFSLVCSILTIDSHIFRYLGVSLHFGNSWLFCVWMVGNSCFNCGTKWWFPRKNWFFDDFFNSFFERIWKVGGYDLPNCWHNFPIVFISYSAWII